MFQRKIIAYNNYDINQSITSKAPYNQAFLRTLLLITNHLFMKNIYFTSIFCLLFSAFSLFGQIPNGYYDTATGKTGATLKTALYDKIKGHTSVGYSGLWSKYPITDKNAAGNVWDIYSNCTLEFGTDQDAGSGGSVECDKFNREHTVPQSIFSEGEPMRSDIFHVYPTDKKVNAVRANYPYSEISSISYTSSNNSKLGTSTFSGFSSTAFEPADEFKGDIARTYFYMVTRYENVLSNWANFEMFAKNTYPSLTSWAVNLLAKWHNQDPVSQKEIDRNNAIYSIQGNRNPYIDHTEYAGLVWNFSVTGVTTTPGVVTIPATNFKPIAKNITYQLSQNQNFNSNIDSLFSDKENDPLTLQAFSGKLSNGSDFLLNSNSNFQFFPKSGFIGSETFTYKICDTDSCNFGTLTFSITGIQSSVSTIERQLLLYPQPAFDVLHIKNLNAEIKNLQLFDLVGNLVFEKTDINSQEIELLVAQFSNGLYLIKLETKEKTLLQRISISK